MTLILVPPGRGRWHHIEVRFLGRRSPLPLLHEYRKGQRYALGGLVYRIAEVRP